MSKDYIKQLEEENAALKKKLEEKAIEDAAPTDIRSLRHLHHISEDMPLVVTNANNKVICKLVRADRNKRNGLLIIKMKMGVGWIFRKWEYIEMMGWFDDWIAYPVSAGRESTDKHNGLLNDQCIAYANGYFRMLESVGLIVREDKRIGMP
jgi:hypothetical protein